MPRTFPSMARVRLNTYSSVADEYYDAQRHPTCRNFRDASRTFLRDILSQLSCSGLALEVGAGDSLLGELAPTEFDQLTLLDKSERMISHSRKFERIANLVVGDALALPFASGAFSLVVASLADPFNGPQFWNEVQRTLKSGAHCIFTTPSYEWARSFRTHSVHEQNGAALFQLLGGEQVYLPSFIEPEASQIEMVQSAGLRLLDIRNFGPAAIPEPHSSKILGYESILTGYVVQRL
jgi:ubiquinone/menaquinone biosynthesis C-methylase UbiE